MTRRGPAALTAKVRRELEMHLECSPQEFGLNRLQWDGPTLVRHLQRRFGIALKVRQAQHWMHQLGYSMKRASHAYLQAHAADAQRFQRALKKLHRLEPNETIVFQDETGFTLHPRLGFGWARRGQRLRVPTTSQHHTRHCTVLGLRPFPGAEKPS